MGRIKTIIKAMETFWNIWIIDISKICAKMFFGIGLDEILKFAA